MRGIMFAVSLVAAGALGGCAGDPSSERFRGKTGAGIYGDVIREIDWSVPVGVGTER